MQKVMLNRASESGISKLLGARSWRSCGVRTTLGTRSRRRIAFINHTIAGPRTDNSANSPSNRAKQIGGRAPDKSGDARFGQTALFSKRCWGGRLAVTPSSFRTAGSFSEMPTCKSLPSQSSGPWPSPTLGFQALFHSAIVEYQAGVRSIFRSTIIFSKSARYALLIWSFINDSGLSFHTS